LRPNSTGLAWLVPGEDGRVRLDQAYDLVLGRHALAAQDAPPGLDDHSPYPGQQALALSRHALNRRPTLRHTLGQRLLHALGLAHDLPGHLAQLRIHGPLRGPRRLILPPRQTVDLLQPSPGAPGAGAEGLHDPAGQPEPFTLSPYGS
jgi:hypothetical protein